MYIHGKASEDKVPAPTFAPNKGKCSEMAAAGMQLGATGWGFPGAK